MIVCFICGNDIPDGYDSRIAHPGCDRVCPMCHKFIGGHVLGPLCTVCNPESKMDDLAPMLVEASKGLKPCPKCKSTRVRAVAIKNNPFSTTFKIMCNECGIFMESYHLDEVVKRWNE